MLKLDLDVLAYRKPNVDDFSFLEVEVISLNGICILQQFSLSLHHDLVGMEVDSIDEESLIPTDIHCFFSFSDLLFLGLPHDILGCSGFDAEVINVGMILSVALIQIHAFN